MLILWGPPLWEITDLKGNIRTDARWWQAQNIPGYPRSTQLNSRQREKDIGAGDGSEGEPIPFFHHQLVNLIDFRLIKNEIMRKWMDRSERERTNHRAAQDVYICSDVISHYKKEKW